MSHDLWGLCFNLPTRLSALPNEHRVIVGMMVKFPAGTPRDTVERDGLRLGIAELTKKPEHVAICRECQGDQDYFSDTCIRLQYSFKGPADPVCFTEKYLHDLEAVRSRELATHEKKQTAIANMKRQYDEEAAAAVAALQAKFKKRRVAAV